jgi:hypothetical protein
MLPDNTTGWKQGWFYLDNPASALRERTGRVPVPGPEWTNQLVSRGTEELKPLLDDLEQLKAEGLTGAVVAISSASSNLSRIGPIRPLSTGAIRPY